MRKLFSRSSHLLNSKLKTFTSKKSGNPSNTPHDEELSRLIHKVNKLDAEIKRLEAQNTGFDENTQRIIDQANKASGQVGNADPKVVEIPMSRINEIPMGSRISEIPMDGRSVMTGKRADSPVVHATYNITMSNSGDEGKQGKLEKKKDKTDKEMKVLMKWMPVIGEVVAITLAAVFKIFGRR